MKNVLTTGATGLVGSRFVEMYQDQYKVANMDLTTGVDITNKTSISNFVKANPAKVLIHLAAFTDTNAAFAQTGDKQGVCYQVNVEGTKNIAEVCQDNGIHLINVSTDFVFNGEKNSPYNEDDPVNPIDWYGETKALAEQAVIASGVGYTIVRIAYPYRREFAAKPDLIKKIRLGLESGQLYPQFSDTTITPTFIDDIARGFAKVIEGMPVGIYHFVGSTSLSPYELAQKVASTFGFDPHIIKEGSLTKYLERAARPFARHVAVSNLKAKKDLDLSFMTIDEGLAAISGK